VTAVAVAVVVGSTVIITTMIIGTRQLNKRFDDLIHLIEEPGGKENNQA
jgi:hypothetical protein